MNKKNEELTAAWCKEISPGLAVFNKAFIRRAGAGLFPYVLLDGNREAVDYCVKKEASLFYSEGVYETDKVHTDIRKKDRGVFLVERYNGKEKDIYSSLSQNGSIIFFGAGKPDHANRYDVSGCDVVSFREAFLPVIGMDCDNKIIENVLRTYPSIWNMDMAEIANNTMLCHYGHADDDILTEADFEWLSGKEPETEEAGTAGTKTTEESTGDISSDKEAPADKKEEKDRSEHGIAATVPVTSGPVKTDEEEDHDKEQTPDEKRTDRDKHTEGLSLKEKNRNQKLLDSITKEYNEVIDMIGKESVPGMFAPVKRVMNESLENTDFDESPIKKYIEVSKDFSTELYKRLYEQTEPIRKTFIRDVRRDYRHLTCYNCSAQWDADATFVKGEIGESKCPSCGTIIRYEP